MDDFEINLEKEIKNLEAQLKKLPKEKWKIWRLIVVGIITPFVGPYIPLRKGMLADRMGYHNSVLLFALIFLFAVPAGCYMHFQKINNEIFDIECQIENLKRQNKQKIEG